MRGNGTQESPYIPENWEEFVEAVGIKDAVVSLPESGGTFNMNQIAPDGFEDSIYVRCAVINGNNWIIQSPRNLSFYFPEDMKKIHTVNQLHILSAYSDIHSDKRILLRGYVYRLNKCKISGEFSTGRYPVFQAGSPTWDETRYYNTLYRCGITAEITGDTRNPFGEQLEFCDVYADLTASTASLSPWFTFCYRLFDSFVYIDDPDDRFQADEINSHNRSIVISSSDRCWLYPNNYNHEIRTDPEHLKDAQWLKKNGFRTMKVIKNG